MKLPLIPDWRQAYKMWSVQFAVACAALPELLAQAAQLLGGIMPALSPTVSNYLPGWLRGALAFASLVAVVLRLVQQPRRPPAPAEPPK